MLIATRYGGIFESQSREYTLDDFYSLQLDKMERYACLKRSEVVIGAEDESSSDDEEGDDENEDVEREDDTGEDEEDKDQMTIVTQTPDEVHHDKVRLLSTADYIHKACGNRTG